MPTDAIRVEISQHVTAFRFYEEGIRSMLRTDVGRQLAEKAVRVESQAKHNATRRPGPNVITGRLRGSITWRLGWDIAGPYADVGTAVFYAPFVELGTSKAPAYPFLRPALEAARD